MTLHWSKAGQTQKGKPPPRTSAPRLHTNRARADSSSFAATCEQEMAAILRPSAQRASAEAASFAAIPEQVNSSHDHSTGIDCRRRGCALRRDSGATPAHDLILAPPAPAARSHQAAKAKTHDLAHEATLHLDHPG